MSFTDFQKNALERGSKRRGSVAPRVKKTWWQRNRRWLIALCAFITGVVIANVIIFTTNQPSHNESDGWYNESYSNSAVEFVGDASYGVHLNKSDQIDKIYEYKDLQKMSKKKRAADNVVSFYEGERIIPMDSWYTVPTKVTVDGVSYAFNTSFDVSFDSLSGTIIAYNELVKKDPTTTLRGYKGLRSLGSYLLNIISPKVTAAVKDGTLAAPVVTYDGTGTEYHNNDIATAYKAGINANLFNQNCNTNPSNTPHSDCTNTLQYDFSCKTVGITYPNWSVFTDQLRKIVKFQDIQTSSPSEGPLKVNTAEPCRIVRLQSSSAPLPNADDPINQTMSSDQVSGF